MPSLQLLAAITLVCVAATSGHGVHRREVECWSEFKLHHLGDVWGSSRGDSTCMVCRCYRVDVGIAYTCAQEAWQVNNGQYTELSLGQVTGPSQQGCEVDFLNGSLKVGAVVGRPLDPGTCEACTCRANGQLECGENVKF